MLHIGKILSKFIKNSSQRELDRLKLTVEKINAWESKVKGIPDKDFPARTAELKIRVKNINEYI